MSVASFDTAWETRYRNPKYRNHYPMSSVVSFVFKNAPAGVDHADVSVLEAGCGNGANLWFAAREGFRVSGIDGSETAVAYARDWFAREGLPGDLRVGDFTSLPFASESFDLVVDRSALSFVPLPALQAALEGIWRVLRPGGRFMFTPYSDRCTSFDGIPDADGCYRRISAGTIQSGSQATFHGIGDVRRLLADGWSVTRLVHNEEVDYQRPDRLTHAQWHVEATKVERHEG